MKHLIKILLLILIPSGIVAQGISNLWLMGYESSSGIPFGGTNIDFISGTPNIYYVNRPMNINCTNANISDANGNLLFYSNGIYIANATNDTMMNGSGLNPGQWANLNYQYGSTIPQANLVLPFPGDSSKYYLFHLTLTYDTVPNPIPPLPRELFYSVIDMTQDGGLGSVISKNNVIINDTLTPGEITACKHANGRDWWVFVHKYQSDKFYKLLITSNGIQTFSQHIGSIRNVFYSGQSVFSPNGNRFAHYNPSTDLDVLDFERCSGNLSNFRHVSINDSMAAGGIAFSPNSDVIYTSSINYVYQFDATVSNIASTQITVAVWDSFYSPSYPFATNFYLSQIAPDGKIYINTGNGTDYLHVINNPDSLSLSCNVCQHCVHLPTYNAFTIPNHPNYFLGCDTTGGCTCFTGIHEILHNFHFSIFPNPSNGNFSISYLLPQNKKGKIVIYDVTGKIYFSQTLPQWSTLQQISLPGIANGLYNCIISSGSNRVSKKLAILKEE